MFNKIRHRFKARWHREWVINRSEVAVMLGDRLIMTLMMTLMMTNAKAVAFLRDFCPFYAALSADFISTQAERGPVHTVKFALHCGVQVQDQMEKRQQAQQTFLQHP